MLFLTSFQFLKRLLISKRVKHFSTYLVGQNGTMWKTCFSAPLNAKNISCNIKTKCVTEFLLTGLRVWKIIFVITWWANKRQTFTLISIKIMRIWTFLFKNNRVFKQKEVVSNLHVCSIGIGKMLPSYIFHFSTSILTSTHTKDFNNFF